MSETENKEIYEYIGVCAITGEILKVIIKTGELIKVENK